MVAKLDRQKTSQLHDWRAKLACLARDHVLTGAQFREVQARIGYLHGKFQKCGKDGCDIAAVPGAARTTWFCAAHISLQPGCVCEGRLIECSSQQLQACTAINAADLYQDNWSGTDCYRTREASETSENEPRE